MAITAEKTAIVAQMKETISEAKGAVLVGYSGLTVAEVTQLRRQFLAEGVQYKVVKNTLARIAAKELGYEEFAKHIEGPTAIATCSDDAVAPARVLANFIKETKTKAINVKAGVIEGKEMGTEDLKTISSLPNREGMLSMLLSVLQAPVRNVACAVKAVADAKEEPAA